MSSPIKITSTGKFVDCVGGKVEMYKVEPHVCPKCGEVTDEFASEYLGRKAAESAVRHAAKNGYKCFRCLWIEAGERVKQMFGN